MKDPENIVSKTFYKIREALWGYPDKLFVGEDSVNKSFKRFYENSLPASNFISSLLIGITIVVLLTSGINALLGKSSDTFIEGVVMGVDENGQILKLNRINPLINTNIQLESDLCDIIYDSLIRVDQSGNAQPQLADFFTLEKGKRYQFKLKQNLYWSDGVKITSKDVAKTFELIKSLESNTQTSNIYSKAAVKIDLKLRSDDDRTFEFDVKGDNVIPGFFEAISFKILPAHLIDDLNADNITLSDPIINRYPVGSGPFKFVSATDGFVNLEANKYYLGNVPSVSKIRFKMFANEKSAYEALITGQIHGLSGVSKEYIDLAKSRENIKTYISNTIYNQYWSLYFNLNDNGPAIFKDINFRKAVNLAIDRKQMIDESGGLIEEAKGPIPPSSFAYLSTPSNTLNIDQANTLLDKTGYVRSLSGLRTKGTDNLTFEIVLINNKDREELANQIKNNLAKVGIDVKITSTDLSTVLDQYILPKDFQMLLYGVQTFIDPDRYELFHSSQIEHPGLNISGYISSSQRTQVVDGKTTKVSSVDDDLNDARRLVDESARIKKYDDFQKVLNEEVPEIFLFYPKEVYLVNSRVKNINMNDVNSASERFESVENWVIN